MLLGHLKIKKTQPTKPNKGEPMTIRLPPPNILDRILTIFGKERGIILPSTHAESSRNGVN